MKRIAIIGGGISGLVVLHYLKQRFGDVVEITLYEREAAVGGTIRSLKKDSCLFEWGPNGFLDNQPSSLELINELGLTDQLIEANQKARRRYIQIDGQLMPVPMDPMSLISTSLLSSKDKWSLIKGFSKKGVSTDCSIYNYVSQRFSVGIAENLVDPFMSGVCAGDIKRLHMAAAFPKVKGKGFKKSRMCSFKGGMGQIIEEFEKRLNGHIKTNSKISLAQLDADITILSTPAYAAAKLIENINPLLARTLTTINYVPVAVAGLLFKEGSFKRKPDGFGYLIASKEKMDVLGVLIESNVYANRAGDDQVLMRVMLGGIHHPEIINESEEQILSKATKELDKIYGLLSQPVKTHVKQWPQAIPQYEINYPQWRQTIKEQCAQTPGLYLCANYLDGISFNDCVNNAKILAGNIKI